MKNKLNAFFLNKNVKKLEYLPAFGDRGQGGPCCLTV